LTVGCHTYRLVLDKQAIDGVSAAGGDVLLGQTDTKQLTIVVDPTQAESQVVDTVVHELMHAMFDLVGAVDVASGDVEESLIRRLAPVWVDVLRRNPRLVGWVCGVDGS
jgi:hypothetical protein